jgi:hypothetical protein
MRRLAFIGSLALVPSILLGQGFGGGMTKLNLKKTVTLERKLPAAVQLPGTAFDVKVTAANPQYRDVAEKLGQMIETELVRFNTELTPTKDAPATVISVSVSNFNVPPPAPASDPYAALGNKKNGQAQPAAYTITGTLAVTYQAKTGTGRSLDAEPFTVKFAEEINTASRTKEFLGKIPRPGKSKATEEESVHTAGDVEQILVTRVADRVAARLVNTNERVEAMLARGSLDAYNRYAEAGQWTDFVEKLETMPPLPRPGDDAYRLYNIGVGNEALGYKATTADSARRYFQLAVIDYRKAADANPHEKYFLDPINRIEVALEHYKKLAAAAPAPASKKSPPAKKAGKP